MQPSAAAVEEMWPSERASESTSVLSFQPVPLLTSHPPYLLSVSTLEGSQVKRPSGTRPTTSTALVEARGTTLWMPPIDSSAWEVGGEGEKCQGAGRSRSTLYNTTLRSSCPLS